MSIYFYETKKYIADDLLYYRITGHDMLLKILVVLEIPITESKHAHGVLLKETNHQKLEINRKKMHKTSNPKNIYKHLWICMRKY